MHVDHATPPAISDKFLDGVQGVLAGAMSPEDAMKLTEDEAAHVSRSHKPEGPGDAGASPATCRGASCAQKVQVPATMEATSAQPGRLKELSEHHGQQRKPLR